MDARPAVMRQWPGHKPRRAAVSEGTMEDSNSHHTNARMGSNVFFSHSIVTKSALDIWSVFLQDGVTPVGSRSDDLISNEGITTVGPWECFFRPVLGVSLCHPLVGRSALKRSGFHILLSSLLARTLCVSL